MRVAARESTPAPACPYLARTTASTASVEYVVQPPSMPTMRNGRSSAAPLVAKLSTSGTRRPMASDPLRLMSRVVVGNWRAESLKVESRRNRATVPSAPPSAMATSTAGESPSRGTATLSSASPSSVMVLLSLVRAAAAPQCCLVRSHQPIRRFGACALPGGTHRRTAASMVVVGAVRPGAGESAGGVGGVGQSRRGPGACRKRNGSLSRPAMAYQQSPDVSEFSRRSKASTTSLTSMIGKPISSRVCSEPLMMFV